MTTLTIGPAGVPQVGINRTAIVIAAGISATTLAQIEVLDLPFRKLLQEQFGADQQSMAWFFTVAVCPWYLKPFAGVLCDHLPLFGSRRRSYLILSGTLAGALWVAAGFAAHSYGLLLAVLVALNAALVIGSTVLGGILVDAKEHFRSAKRLMATRVVADSFCTAIGGLLSGYLAGLPLPMAAAVGGLIAFIIAPVALLLFSEAGLVDSRQSTLADLGTNLRAFVTSPTALAAAVFLLAVNIPQSFTSALYFVQINTLGFSQETIGLLNSCAGVGGLTAPLVYVRLSRRIRPRLLLSLAIAAAGCATLAFVFYQSFASALVIHVTSGFLFTFIVCTMIEAAVLGTQRALAATGFAVLMSVCNVGMSVGDNAAAALVKQTPLGFPGMILLFAVVTFLLLLGVRYLPNTLFAPDADYSRP